MFRWTMRNIAAPLLNIGNRLKMLYNELIDRANQQPGSEMPAEEEEPEIPEPDVPEDEEKFI